MEERIDRYITGRMTAEEVLQFRKDLNTDATLREEYERAKEISDSVQRNALKAKLQAVEQKTRHRRFDMRWISYIVGAAASLVLFAVSGRDYAISNRLKSTSAGVFSELDVPVSRSANVVDELLENAYEEIAIGELNAATQHLKAVDNAIKDQMQEENENAELNEYYHSILMVQEQEAEWYRALILMRKGRVYKSRAALKSIAEKNGIYAEEAKNLLESMFNL